jgi:hypothetical protein
MSFKVQKFEGKQIESKKHFNMINQKIIKQNMVKVSFVLLIVIFLVNYFFYKFIKLPPNVFNLSIGFTFLMPLFIIVYSLWYQYYFLVQETKKEILDEFEKEKLLEKGNNISVLLFGLALFITVLDASRIGVIIPYILCAVAFGSTMVELLDNLIFDHLNIERVIVIEEFKFGFLMLSNGFLFMSFYLTYFYFIKKIKN